MGYDYMDLKVCGKEMLWPTVNIFRYLRENPRNPVWPSTEVDTSWQWVACHTTL